MPRDMSDFCTAELVQALRILTFYLSSKDKDSKELAKVRQILEIDSSVPDKMRYDEMDADFLLSDLCRAKDTLSKLDAAELDNISEGLSDIVKDLQWEDYGTPNKERVCPFCKEQVNTKDISITGKYIGKSRNKKFWCHAGCANKNFI